MSYKQEHCTNSLLLREGIQYNFCHITSCQSDEPMPEELRNDKTLIMYMPWSSNLTGYFYQNIRDTESCIEERGGLSNERVIVFISKTSTEAYLFEIKYKNGKCQRLEIKSYSSPAFTTKAGMELKWNSSYLTIATCHR